MEIQLKDLIEKVKSEGISQGKQQAQEITKSAETKAESIINDAQKKAESMINQARDQAERLKTKAEESVKIALRDLVLKFSNRIKELFNRIILTETKDVFNADLLKEVIADLIDKWNRDETGDLKLELPEDSHHQLFEFFQKKLSQHLKKGMKITPDTSLDKGFVISLQDGTMHYDFSANTITDIIAQNIEPEIMQLLKAAAVEA